MMSKVISPLSGALLLLALAGGACSDDESDSTPATMDAPTDGNDDTAAPTDGTDEETSPATPDFGSDTDVDEAQTLWQAIDGYQDWQSFPGLEGIQPGGSPHGDFVRFYVNDICAEDTENPANGSIIIKENYGDEAGEMLGAITVMEKRDGYDADAADWFWVKYLPDGDLDQTMDGKPLAGRVAGCRGCHASAEGDDGIFVN